MFEDLKNIPKQKIRKDTPWRLGIGLVLSLLIFLVFPQTQDFLLFAVLFFWCQTWSYGEDYLNRPFRPSVMRIIMELYWPLTSLKNRVQGKKKILAEALPYLPPFLFGLLFSLTLQTSSILTAILALATAYLTHKKLRTV